MPLCTTRFLQVLQQAQAWLHSKISGGSILLNSCSNRPSWGWKEGHVIPGPAPSHTLQYPSLLTHSVPPPPQGLTHNL